MLQHTYVTAIVSRAVSAFEHSYLAVLVTEGFVLRLIDVYRTMKALEFSFWFDTINLEWPIVNIDGSHIIYVIEDRCFSYQIV